MQFRSYLFGALLLMAATSTQGQVSFGGPLAISTGMSGGAGPQLVEAGDVDGDTIDDVVFTHDGTSQVGVILSAGFFQTVDAYAAGASPRGLALADINNDGYLDIVVTNETSDMLTILTNDGTGVFLAGSTIACGIGSGPTRIAVGDFDLDGKIDLAVNHRSLGEVGVYLNSGSGTFTAPTTYATGTSPTDLAAGDMDQNGSLDLVVIDSTDDNWRVLSNNGSGLFSVGTPKPAMNSFPETVGLADKDGDSDLDVFIGNFVPANLSIFENQGFDVFGFSAASSGVHIVQLALADFDADGLDEVVGCDIAFNAIRSFENQNGVLIPDASFFATGNEVPVAIATGDFDGDYHDDIVYINSGANNVVLRINNESAPRLAGGLVNGAVGRATTGIAEKILTIDNSDGGFKHAVNVGVNALTTISILQPSTNPIPSLFAIWGILDVPNKRQRFDLPNGLGRMILPPQVADLTNPNLFTVTNSFFVDPLQMSGNGGTPWAVEFFTGPSPLRVTLQGLVGDTPTSYAVTNAIILDIN